MKIDLHGIKHKDVPEVLDSFVWDCIKFNIEQFLYVSIKFFNPF
jgi:hypothetical protein